MPADRAVAAGVLVIAALCCGFMIFRPTVIRDWARSFWLARPSAFWAQENLHLIESKHFPLVARLSGLAVGVGCLVLAYLIGHG